VEYSVSTWDCFVGSTAAVVDKKGPTAALPGHPGFDQDSIFALLEHADEQGEIQSTGTAADTSRLSSQASAKTNPNNQAGKKQAPVKQQAAAASRPSTGQSARAEDYYRAFEHVYRDAGADGAPTCHALYGYAYLAQHH